MLLKYKGYRADVRLGCNQHGQLILIGQVIDIEDAIAFQARHISFVRNEFHKAIDDYLEFCSDVEQDPACPIEPRTNYEVAYPFRTSPETRHLIQKAADRDSTTVNCWIEQALPSKAPSVRYFLERPSDLDDLLGKIRPYIHYDDVDSIIALRCAFEKLLAGMDAMREFVDYSDYESFGRIVMEIESALKNIPPEAEMVPADSHSHEKNLTPGKQRH
ncbi:MAG: hypothetical protein AAF289_01350 [Cyanobacteria bacterium P01_A01_bin.135]